MNPNRYDVSHIWIKFQRKISAFYILANMVIPTGYLSHMSNITYDLGSVVIFYLKTADIYDQICTDCTQFYWMLYEYFQIKIKMGMI